MCYIDGGPDYSRGMGTLGHAWAGTVDGGVGSRHTQHIHCYSQGTEMWLPVFAAACIYLHMYLCESVLCRPL